MDDPCLSSGISKKFEFVISVEDYRIQFSSLQKMIPQHATLAHNFFTTNQNRAHGYILFVTTAPEPFFYIMRRIFETISVKSAWDIDLCCQN